MGVGGVGGGGGVGEGGAGRGRGGRAGWGKGDGGKWVGGRVRGDGDGEQRGHGLQVGDYVAREMFGDGVQVEVGWRGGGSVADEVGFCEEGY